MAEDGEKTIWKAAIYIWDPQDQVLYNPLLVGMTMLYMFRVQRWHRPWGSNTAGVYMSRMQHGVTRVKIMTGDIEPDPGGHIWLFKLTLSCSRAWKFFGEPNSLGVYVRKRNRCPKGNDSAVGQWPGYTCITVIFKGHRVGYCTVTRIHVHIKGSVTLRQTLKTGCRKWRKKTDKWFNTIYMKNIQGQWRKKKKSYFTPSRWQREHHKACRTSLN